MATTHDWRAGIYEISKVINATHDVGEVLEVIARETRRFVDFDRLVVALLEDSRQHLRLHVAVGPAEGALPDDGILELEGHALGHAVRRMEPLLIADLAAEDRFPGDRPLADEGVAACAVFPLVSQGTVLGALAVARHERRPFSHEEVEVLREVAEQTATAVDHARLLATEKKRANHLTIINEVAKRALATFDLQTLLQQTASLIQKQFAYYDVSIFLVDRSAGEVELRAQAGAYRGESAVGYRQPLGVGMVGWSAKTGKTLLASDVSKDPHYVVAFEGERQSRSELCVPVRIGGDTLGVINVESTRVGAFDQIDVTALETLSDQVAQAIENARLYDEMRYLKELDESILASIPSSILVLDPDLRVVSVNEMCCRVLERGREGIVGERFEDLIQFETLDHEVLRRTMQRVIEGDQRASFAAIRIRLPNRRTRIADIYLSPVARRTQRRALVFINDITDRRRAEEDVLREKQKLDDIVSAVGAGLVLLDPDLTIVWSNPTMDQWFGGGRSLVGQRCHSVCRGAQTPCPDCGALATFADGEVHTSSQVAMVADHSARHFQNILAPIRSEDGRVVQVIRLTFDVTEHARKVEQVSLIQKLAQAMQGARQLDRLLHLILTCVTAGPGLGFNRAFLLLVDDAHTTLEGRLGVGPASREEAARIWRELSERDQSLDDLLGVFDQAQELRDSAMKYISQQLRFDLSEKNVAPVRAVTDKVPIVVADAAEDGNVPQHLHALLGVDQFVCVPLIARDVALGAIIADNVYSNRPITEDEVEMLETFATHAGLAISSARAYKRLEEQLNELEEAQDRLVRSERLATVGRLAAHVAHEIRNPLATIGGFTRSMARSPGNVAKVRRNARIILEEVERLEQILANVMNFSKPGNPVLRERDVNEIADAVCAFHENVLAERGIALHKSLDPQCPILRIDPDQIRQVLINLIQNALDSMPGGGELTILTRPLEDHVEVVVADTGHGMNGTVMESLFQPFYTTKVGGTGLGLSVSQKIIHDHGGDILVHSQPGKGSSFTVCLPIPEASKEPA
ncbi:MAG: GAF domain-containing protein [bacterium]